MIVIYDTYGTKLSTYTQNISPRIYGGKTIMREYLDGSNHIQVIGEASEGYSFDVLVTRAQAEAINREQAKGTILRIKDKETGIDAKGHIRNQVRWALILRGKKTLYKGQVDFIKRATS